jgi:hypothetical protein
MPHLIFRRSRITLLAVACVALLGACSDFLKATNPGAIDETKLNDPRYLALEVNGVVGEFQPAASYLATYNAVFTDEVRNHHSFFENRDMDRRVVDPGNGTYSTFVYGPLNRARFLADSVASRLKIVLGDSASRDVRLARVRAYGGYSYVLLAENLCVAAVDVSRPYPPDSLFNFAIARLTEAVTVANAVKATATATAAQKAAADSLINFANVGIARANLGLNRPAAAIAAAQLVPAGFQFRVYFSGSAGFARGENQMYWGMADSANSVNRWAAVDGTPFESIVDSRLPLASKTLMDKAVALVPNSPTSYSTYGSAVDWSRGGWMRIASGLEAQYIVAESQGPTAATLAFVNARRSAGGQGPYLGTDPMAELRVQRKIDFYLDGHRLGDMRRYKRFYGVDEYQKGAYPGTSTGEVYGSQTCWPLSASEMNGNPNVLNPFPGYNQ